MLSTAGPISNEKKRVGKKAEKNTMYNVQNRNKPGFLHMHPITYSKLPDVTKHVTKFTKWMLNLHMSFVTLHPSTLMGNIYK